MTTITKAQARRIGSPLEDAFYTAMILVGIVGVFGLTFLLYGVTY